MRSPPPPPMESPIGKLIYCCISRNNRILFSYNGGDQALEALASLCIEKTPPFHSHYFHTAGTRTFAFLIDDDGGGDHSPLTCFAITDHSLSKPNLLHLLHQIKNRFKSNTNLDEELLPVLRRLISSLESINRSDSNSNSTSNSFVSIDGSSSTEAPLLGIERKNSVKVDGVEKMEVSVNPESLVQKSSSFSNRNRQIGRRLWWRHVKIVVVADLFICLILFGVWLAVCRGFRCVS